MNLFSKSETGGMNKRFLVTLAVALAVTVFVLTWFGIMESRSDSYDLLVLQGKSFTESLAQASDNAIVSEMFYDRLIQSRYSDLVDVLSDIDLAEMDAFDLEGFAQSHDLFAVYVYGIDSSLINEAVARGPLMPLPEYVYDEVGELIADPESNYVTLLDASEPGSAVHYYIELTNRMDRVVVLVVDANQYAEALQTTGIGYLARNLAREQGVEYIIYQSTEGIIFSSRRVANLLAIESDPFLTEALDSDTMYSREYDFQGTQVLELVRPFSSEKYPFGLFRVGLSLDGYYAVSKGHYKQMAILAVVLFVLLLVAIMYLNSREKRHEISRRYTRIKSVTDQIFDQMHTGVAVVDGDGRIKNVNQAFEHILEIKDAEGRKFSEVVSAEVLDLSESANPAGGVIENEIQFTAPGGAKTLLVSRSDISHSEGGELTNLLVVYDITRLKEFERTAARKQRLSEMGDLAAGVAHEIRNPLNTISIAIQRLASEFAPKEGSEEFLSFTDKIRSETKRLNEIITRFLALAREETRSRSSVRLDRLLGEVVEFIGVEADKLSIELSTDVSAEIEIQADPDKLKQVFINLFNNAKEAFEGNPGKVAIVSARQGGNCVVTFSDNGPGIKPEIRDEVFTPYFTTKEAGTGLGLPTIHKIVTESGGEITATESEWGGARFTITLPIQLSR